MAYSNFTLKKIREELGIENKRTRILTDFTPMMPSDNLKAILAEAEELPVRSEKAKSEWIVVPILRELRQRNNKFFTVYSGDILNADEARGLNGECDFILTKDTGTFDINYPIIQIVEAKKNDTELGVPQCAAQLVGSKIYNEDKGISLPTIHGCVTTGNEWLFMVLEGDLIKINTKIYYLNEIENVLGIFQEIIGHYVEVLA